jgi:hypothetical protein
MTDPSSMSSPSSRSRITRLLPGIVRTRDTLSRLTNLAWTTATTWIWENWRSIVCCLTISLTFTALSIRDFLFGAGYFEYADQNWAPSGSVYPTGYYSPNPISSSGQLIVFQFSRDFITWPIGLFHALGLDSLTQEKFFFAYSFALFVILSYLFSSLVIRYLSAQLKVRLPWWKGEVMRCVLTTALFTNLFILYSNTDGGSFTGSLIVVFLGISLLLLIAEKDFRLALAVTVILTTLGFLLDPSYLPAVGLSLLLALGCRELLGQRSLRTFVTRLLQILAGLALPLAALAFLLYPTIGTWGPTSIDVSVLPGYGIRPYNLFFIQYFSGNTSLMNVLNITGFPWSTLTFAPPSIVTYSGQYRELPSLQSPTAIVLPAGILSPVWLVSLFAPLTLTFLSLLSRRLREVTLPFAAILLACVAATQWPWFPPAAGVVSDLTSIPIVGPPIGQALYFPFFFMAGEVAAMIVLLGALLLLLADWSLFPLKTRNVASQTEEVHRPASRSRHLRMVKWSRRTRSRIVFVGTVTCVAILLVFPGWQAFDGSFFPSRSWSTYVSGNGVPNAGPFEPLQPPAGVQQAFDFLENQAGSFNIYWPTGGANETDLQRGAIFFNVYDSPKPTAPLPDLPSLVAAHDTGSLLPYLESQNVEYFVLQNTSPIALQDSYYGLSSYAALQNLFDAVSGLSPVLSFSNLTVYSVDRPWGTSYPIRSALTYDGISGEYGVAYGINSAIGGRTAVLPSGTSNESLTIDNLSGTESVLSPSFLQNYSGLGTVSNQSLSIPLEHYVTSPSGDYSNLSAAISGPAFDTVQRAGTILSVGNWSIADWGPSNVSLKLVNGTVTWSALGLTTVTVNVGGLLTTGPGGVEILNPSDLSSSTSLGLVYQTSTMFRGELSSYLVNEPINGTVGVYPDSSTLAPSSAPSRINFGAPTMPWTRYFNTRFQAIIRSGSLELSQLNYSWNLPNLNFTWNVSGDYQPIGGWSLINWSSPGPLVYKFTNGDLSWISPYDATTSLNFGLPLTSGPGGVTNPKAGSDGVSATLRLRYQTSAGFEGSITVAGYYQTSSLNTTPSLTTQTQDLLTSTTWQTVTYSASFPSTSLNFTVRLEATSFSGEINLSDVSFSWALLPSVPAASFGDALSVSQNNSLTLSYESNPPVGEVFVGLYGPAPPYSDLFSVVNRTGNVSWYEFRGDSIDLTQGDEVTAVVAVTSYPFQTVHVGVQYTGPFAVDLILNDGQSTYRPIETLDGDSVFWDPGWAGQAVTHSSTTAMLVVYLLLLLYLAVFPGMILAVSRLRLGRRRKSQRKPRKR